MQDISNYWVVTASKDHAAHGKACSIVQANHGKDASLRRMRPGDGVVIYSPRTTYPDGPPCQAFTLIGRVADGEPFQHQVSGTVMWRRSMLWQDAQPAPIRPLLQDLAITRGLTSWGMAFRYGLTKLSRQDFACIARAMVTQAQPDAHQP